MLGQARADLAAAKAHLCPHGIAWSVCRDHHERDDHDTDTTVEDA
jgi:hypothetical protein